MLCTAGQLGTITRQPFTRMMGLDGYKYLMDCDTVAAIDTFFISECSQGMTATDMEYAMDLMAYEDTGVGRPEIQALSNLMYLMVTTGKDCTTLNGEISGCE